MRVYQLKLRVVYLWVANSCLIQFVIPRLYLKSFRHYAIAMFGEQVDIIPGELRSLKVCQGQRTLGKAYPYCRLKTFDDRFLVFLVVVYIFALFLFYFGCGSIVLLRFCYFSLRRLHSIYCFSMFYLFLKEGIQCKFETISKNMTSKQCIFLLVAPLNMLQITVIC